MGGLLVSHAWLQVLSGVAKLAVPVGHGEPRYGPVHISGHWDKGVPPGNVTQRQASYSSALAEIDMVLLRNPDIRNSGCCPCPPEQELQVVHVSAKLM